MLRIQCKRCSIEFEAQRITRKYCSAKCTRNDFYDKNYRSLKKTIKINKICKNCDNNFLFFVHKSHVKTGHNGTFCNRKCMIEFLKKNAFNFPCFVCKKAIYTQPAQLKLRARSTCSPICRRTLARERTLKKHDTYTKHQIDRLARYSIEAVEWRKAIFARDDYTCQECKVRGGYIEADHIKPWAYFPSLRFELSNGRTLCRLCHDKTKIGYKKMRELYGSQIVSYEQLLANEI